MRRLPSCWAALALVVVLGGAGVANAQAVGADAVRRPAISPWLSLYQKNGGPLDNYHMFVRPRFQVLNNFQQQSDAIQRNDANIAATDRQMSSYQQRLGVRPTGSGSTFMYYSHYYPTSGPGGQQASSGQRRWAVARSAPGGSHGPASAGR
jgi:hypothetical protein